MARVVRADACEGERAVSSLRRLDEVRQRDVRDAVGVVGQEPLLALEVRLHGGEPLADGGREARVDERDGPVVDVGLEQRHLGAAGQHEVVGDRLVVVHEVALDVGGAVAEAQDKVLVPVVGVILHQVPQDGARADGDHRLGDGAGVIPDPHSFATAEEDDFHDFEGCAEGVATGDAESVPAPSPAGSPADSGVQTVPARRRKTGWTGRPTRNPSVVPASSAWA